MWSRLNCARVNDTMFTSVNKLMTRELSLTGAEVTTTVKAIHIYTYTKIHNGNKLMLKTVK